MTHICVGKLNIIGSDNGLSPGRRQATIWTNARILSIRPFATNFSELLIGIQTVSFTKMYLKISSAKWRPYCLGLNVLSPFQEAMTTKLLVPLWQPNAKAWVIMTHHIENLEDSIYLIATATKHMLAFNPEQLSYTLTKWNIGKQLIVNGRVALSDVMWNATLHTNAHNSKQNKTHCFGLAVGAYQSWEQLEMCL